jgi:hypothetical protein
MKEEMLRQQGFVFNPMKMLWVKHRHRSKA